jgi:hypothetical protein
MMKLTSKSTSTSGSEMKAKFKVGDRVSVYFDYNGPYKAVVSVDPTPDDKSVVVEWDGGCSPNKSILQRVHIKQCRKLVKKKLRELWVKTDGAMSVLSHILQQDVSFDGPIDTKGWIRFKECK